MILYKYTKADGVDILRNSRLLVLNPCKSNDPFELALHIPDLERRPFRRYIQNKSTLWRYYFKGILSGKRQMSWGQFKSLNSDPSRLDEIVKSVPRQITEQLRSTYNPEDSSKFFYICCFCGEARRGLDEILMWSHYTGAHGGLRFWFDSTMLGPSLEKVAYSENIPICDPAGFFDTSVKNPQSQILLSLRTKGVSWDYEQEHRWFVPTKKCKCDIFSRRYYTAIDLKSIKRIDFGLRCDSKTINSVIKVRKRLGLAFELKRAVKSKSAYQLLYTDI